ncbi:hypothetical protein [Emticicia sp.]|uniref:hypothetical protein n=1 Tax=Emticicia sp. TaxID=1930953 RepID=UPI003753A25C
MAKKSKLGGYKFEKLTQISNGLIIPTGNDTRPKEAESPKTAISSFVEPKVKPIVPMTKQPVKKSHNFKRIDIDSNAFTPMTNVVPTINPMNVPTNKVVVESEEKPKFKGLSRRARQRITPEDLDMVEFGALLNKQERITYLAVRGWSLKVESRGNGFYHYATRYINRKKKRLYLGSVIEEM